MSWLKGTAKVVPDGFNMVNKEKREGETIIKLVEYGNDWTYKKNVYGVILSRSIDAKALVQDQKTKLCFIIDITFGQENVSSGGAKYGPVYFSRKGEFSNPGSTGYFVRECAQ